ncbi:TetR/AcrR family transcriptional regulator [Iodobacter sp. HSC-16F04]|uniref:TetR/AcrR family transcriptional regulator n=1 Tax=Iodobacter violaceini TaxID=3044271 RepID=A0ABX0KV89_9NEIS|nr:TetR/AcrR family transcriptional regulator [Iodobacter violacea]NHQ88586.1 TetR/AcrR family transcriptional regulator [Iodobacter violacea]
MVKSKLAEDESGLDPVICAAKSVFCEMGYRASIEKVAARAGVARQTIYNRFGSKQALFELAIDHFIGEMLAPLAVNEGDVRERLLRFSLSFRAQIMTPESVKAHRVLTGEAPRFPELARRHFELCIERTAKQLAAQLETAMQEGVLRPADPFEAATFLFDMLAGYDQLKLLFGGEPPDPAGETAKVNRIVDMFLRAYQV